MRTKVIGSIFASGVVLSVLAACGAGSPALPDTSGSAVDSYLDEIDYREQWELWPGKGELYQGVEPHGLLLTTYANEAALKAVNDKSGAMPEGAMIVKENYMPDGNYDSATVMYKVSDYNPDHNDWFFAKYGSDGTIQAEGRVEGCQACHSSVKDNDYIFTSPLQ